MNRKRTPILTLFVLVVGLASFGCNFSSGGDLGDGGSTGGGGSGGAGGAGGADPAMLRVAHLAPEVPRSGATEVDFTIVDQGSFNSIGFGRVSRYGALSSGVYFLAVTEPGGGPPLATLMPDLEAGVRYTVVAYRDSGAMSLMLFEERTDGLGIERGLVLAAHAADDSSWGALHLINAGTDEVLAADLAFGIVSDPIDLVAGEYELGFAVASPPPAIDRGPFRASVEAAQSLILVVVDADTADESVDPSVYILTPDTIGMITATPLE
jgi:hypothetical protein